MRCYKCNKQIPPVATICPYCSTPVEVNYKKNIDFGDISNLDYDNKNDLKTYIQEPKKRKNVIVGIILVILIFITFAGLIKVVLFPEKERLDIYFLETLDNIHMIINNNFLDSNYAKSGEYKLNLSINGETHEFNGRYERGIKQRILKLNGVIKDPNEQSGGVILDSKEFSFDTYLTDNNLYFKSEQIFNEYLKFEIPNYAELLTTENYNLDVLLDGLVEGVKSSLRQVEYNRENTKINYRGVEAKTIRYYFVLDNKGKLNFIKNFYNSLIDNPDFINEYARLSNKENSEIVELLKEKIREAEVKYSGPSNNSITFSIYVSDKKILRYYIDILEDDHKVYQIDIKDGKYFFDYFLNDKNEISATFAKTEENHGNVKNTNYVITWDNDQYVMDIIIDFKEDEETQINEEIIENYQEFKNLTEEEQSIIKTNLLKYITHDYWIEFLFDYFKEKCTLGMECNCEENSDVCSCLVDGKTIECKREKIIDELLKN